MEGENTEKNSFKDYNLKFELLRGLNSLGLESPTNIQKKVFLSLLSSTNDILVRSPKLTGKKFSFVIYSLQRISKDKKESTQCLILCHTREAVAKIKNIYKDLSKFMNIKIHSLLGGTIKDDIKEISGGCEVVIGTPGRVLDLLNKKILNLSDLDFFVIDDIKQMIERGFIETIFNILNLSNNKCRKAIFEENIEIQKDENNNIISGLNEEVKDKLKIGKDIIIINILLNIYKMMNIPQSIIYFNEQQTMSDVNKNLSDINFMCNSLNEDKSKNITYFKKGQIRIITINSDYDIETINLFNKAIIIIYQMPLDIDTYIKVFGRNEFYGEEGIIINFVTEDNKDLLYSLEKLIGETIQELPKEFSQNI